MINYCDCGDYCDWCHPELCGDGPIYDAITGEVWTCPGCGSTTGKPVPYDFGTDPETGYHDAGEGCTECTPGGGR